MIEPVRLNDIFLPDDDRAIVCFPVLSVDEVACRDNTAMRAEIIFVAEIFINVFCTGSVCLVQLIIKIESPAHYMRCLPRNSTTGSEVRRLNWLTSVMHYMVRENIRIT